MLVSFSGAQSTGKTTLLKACQRHADFRKFHIIPEITRKVAREHNLDINEAGDSITQLFILNEHLHNHFIKGDALLDRCILDGWVYTHYLYSKGKVSGWVKEYAGALYDTLIQKLDIIFYTDPQDVPIEDDGQRSIDRGFRRDIIKAFEWELESCPGKVVRLEGSVEDRMETILKTIKSYDRSIR